MPKFAELAAIESALFIWRARFWMGGQTTLRALRTNRPESSACLTGQRNSKRSASIVQRRLRAMLSDRGLSPRLVASAQSHDEHGTSGYQIHGGPNDQPARLEMVVRARRSVTPNGNCLQSSGGCQRSRTSDQSVAQRSATPIEALRFRAPASNYASVLGTCLSRRRASASSNSQWFLPGTEQSACYSADKGALSHDHRAAPSIYRWCERKLRSRSTPQRSVKHAGPTVPRTILDIRIPPRARGDQPAPTS